MAQICLEAEDCIDYRKRHQNQKFDLLTERSRFAASAVELSFLHNAKVILDLTKNKCLLWFKPKAFILFVVYEIKFIFNFKGKIVMKQWNTCFHPEFLLFKLVIWKMLKNSFRNKVIASLARTLLFFQRINATS